MDNDPDCCDLLIVIFPCVDSSKLLQKNLIVGLSLKL